jgi:hypothetical protein
MRDVFTGAMSFRRLAVLLERLPVESEYKTELRETTDLSALPPPEPGSYGSWSQLELLVARLGDRMDHWLWMNADPKSRPASPPPALAAAGRGRQRAGDLSGGAGLSGVRARAPRGGAS